MTMRLTILLALALAFILATYCPPPMASTCYGTYPCRA